MTRSRQTADWGSRAGLAKIVPSSVAVGSGTGSADSLGTVTFSGCSSVSLNGVFSSTYENYKLLIRINSANSTPALYCRLRVSGTDTSTNYFYAASWRGSSTTTFTTDNGDPSSVFVLGKLGNNHSLTSADISSPFEASYTSFNSLSGAGDNTNEGYVMWSGGSQGSTTSFTGFTLLASAGNISGAVSVYGYTK